MLTIFIIAALAIFLLSLDFGWSNVLASHRNDLVFQERNHDYGAYALRREHHVNLFYAMLLSVGLVCGGCYALARASHAIPPPDAAPSIQLIDVTLTEKMDPIQEEKPAPKRAVAAAPIVEDVEVRIVEQPIEDIPDLSVPPSIGPEDPNAQAGLQGPVGGGGTGTSTSTIDSTAHATPFVHEVLQHMPKFPGGDEALMAFIRSHVVYDEQSIERGVQGTIYVSFVVMPTGDVDMIEIVRGIPNGRQLESSVLSTIQKLPKWEPGMQNGRPVRVRKTIPVRFDLIGS
jgi:protein TonB